MRKQGGGKQSNNREVVWHRGGEGGGKCGTWKAEGINKGRKIEEMMIGEEGVALGVKRWWDYWVWSARHDLSVKTRYVYLCVRTSFFCRTNLCASLVTERRGDRREQGVLDHSCCRTTQRCKQISIRYVASWWVKGKVNGTGNKNGQERAFKVFACESGDKWKLLWSHLRDPPTVGCATTRAISVCSHKHEAQYGDWRKRRPAKNQAMKNKI